MRKLPFLTIWSALLGHCPPSENSIKNALIPRPSQLLWEAFSHAAIARRLFVHIITTVCIVRYSFIQLSELWHRDNQCVVCSDLHLSHPCIHVKKIGRKDFTLFNTILNSKQFRNVPTPSCTSHRVTSRYYPYFVHSRQDSNTNNNIILQEYLRLDHNVVLLVEVHTSSYCQELGSLRAL